MRQSDGRRGRQCERRRGAALAAHRRRRLANRPASAALLEGVAAYDRKDYASAYRLLKAEADRGSSTAQVQLGFMYARGHGVKADQAEALRLYRLAAAQGDAEGMNAIGYKYDQGTGVIPDPAQAARWYCMAVLRGDPRASNNLAILHDQGRGAAQDREEARRLWRRAADAGHHNGMLNLGLALLRDYPAGSAQAAEGKTWLGRALEGGSAHARAVVGEVARRNMLDPSEFVAAARAAPPSAEEPTLAACQLVS